jgi:hypothetical protein
LLQLRLVNVSDRLQDAVNAAIRDSGDELPATKTSRVKTGDESIKHKKKTRRAGRRIKKVADSILAQNPGANAAIQWKAGDLCLAPYSEDGEYYDALVVSVNSGNGRCSVEFLGYGEVEDVPLSSVHKYDRHRALVLTRRRVQLKAKKRPHSVVAQWPSSAVVASTSAVYCDSLTAVVRKKFRRDDDDGEETVEDDVEVEPDTPTSRVR